MRFLLDQNQSPLLVELLTAAGHDVVHVRDLGLSAAADHEILAVAAAERRTIISADMDFGELLSESNASGPSIVMFRRQGQRRVVQIAALLLANLDAVIDDLEGGAIVVLDTERIRVRRLPMQPD